jgi:hypothetical protein
MMIGRYTRRLARARRRRRHLAELQVLHQVRRPMRAGQNGGAALATRNVPDFEGCGVEVINPWIAS